MVTKRETKKKITVQLGAKVYKFLEQRAALASVSISEFLNDLIETYVDSQDEERMRQLRRAQRQADNSQGTYSSLARQD